MKYRSHGPNCKCAECKATGCGAFSRMSTKNTPEYWADWLVDAVATATQDRRFLRGDPAEDKIATEAIYLNGKHALTVILSKGEVKS